MFNEEALVGSAVHVEAWMACELAPHFGMFVGGVMICDEV
jgi:hypothetical protein